MPFYAPTASEDPTRGRIAIDPNLIGYELGNEGTNRSWLPLLQHLGIDPATAATERAFYDPSGEGGPTYGVGFNDDALNRLRGITYSAQEMAPIDGRSQTRMSFFDQQGNPLTEYQVGGDNLSSFNAGMLATQLAMAAMTGYGLTSGAGAAGAAGGTDASYLAAADAAGGMVPQYGTTAAYNAGVGLGETGTAAGSGGYSLINGGGDLYTIPQSGSVSSMNASGGYNLIDGTGNMNALYSTPSQGQFAGMNISQLDAARAGLGAASAASGRSQAGGQGGLLGDLGEYGKYGQLIAGLLGGAAGGLGGGSGSPGTITYGDPVKWNSELQRGLLTTPKRVSSGLLGSN